MAKFAQGGECAAFGHDVAVFAVFAQKDEGKEKQGVVGTPCHESPVGTVPQAAHKKDDKCVKQHTPLGHTAATHGNVDIVTEPGGEGNVPATPELGDVAAEIGHVEIASQVDAEEFGTADGDVAVAGEVAVDLDGEKEGSQQQRRAVEPVGMVEDNVDIDGATVGYHHLLEKTPQHLPETVDSGGVIKPARPFELGQQAGGTFDRTSHELGEETDVSKEGDDVAGGLHVAPVHVDAVAEGLEGVERDAHGQNQMQEDAVGVAAKESVGKGLGEEVVVFKQSKDEQVEYYVCP